MTYGSPINAGREHPEPVIAIQKGKLSIARKRELMAVPRHMPTANHLAMIDHELEASPCLG